MTGDVSVNSFSWSSSIDGGFGSTASRSYHYSLLSPGEHKITLSATTSNQISIEPVITTLRVFRQPEVDNISVSHSPVQKGEIIRFHVNCSVELSDFDCPIVRYAWRSDINGEFGNSTVPYCNTTSLSSGVHLIFVKVQDDLGMWSKEKSIQVEVMSKKSRGDEDGFPMILLGGLIGIFLVVLFVKFLLPKYQTSDQSSLESWDQPIPQPEEQNSGGGENQDIRAGSPIADGQKSDTHPPPVFSGTQQVQSFQPIADPQTRSRIPDVNVCPGCGAAMKFIPPLQKWYCTDCKNFQ